MLFFPNNTEYCWGTIAHTFVFFSFCVNHYYRKKTQFANSGIIDELYLRS